MDERAQKILEAAVQEFIDTGEPVSSGWLYDNFDFGIKPAMIRLELEKLAEEGLLEQPYHSAGRIPTNDGYEFFAEKMLSFIPSEFPAFFRNLQILFEEEVWSDLVGSISEELGVFGALGDRRERQIYKEGLENLVENLEWRTKDELAGIIKDCEEVDKKINQLAGRISRGEPQVFIGKKNPVIRSENVSVIVEAYNRNGDRVVLLTVGPKRMDYKKAIKIFRSLNTNERR